jgi:hypothetical protein
LLLEVEFQRSLQVYAEVQRCWQSPARAEPNESERTCRRTAHQWGVGRSSAEKVEVVRTVRLRLSRRLGSGKRCSLMRG